MKASRWISVALIGAMALWIAGGDRGVIAQEKPFKIAVVDLDRVVKQSKFCVAKATEFTETIKTDAGTLEKKAKEIEALEKEVEVLDPESAAVSMKRRLLIEKRAAAQAESAALKMETQEKYAAAMVHVYKRILAAIDKVRDRDGFSVVLRKAKVEFDSAAPAQVIQQLASSAVLSHHDGIDVTERVIAAVDAAKE